MASNDISPVQAYQARMETTLQLLRIAVEATPVFLVFDTPYSRLQVGCTAVAARDNRLVFCLDSCFLIGCNYETRGL